MKSLRRNKNPPQAHTGVTARVRRLKAKQAEAKHLAVLDSDTISERLRLVGQQRKITAGLLGFLACGLAYTTTGVHEFLAVGLTTVDVMWWGAWCIEPALAGILVTVLSWETSLLSRGVDIDAQPVTHLKRLLLSASWVMNVVPAVGRKPFSWPVLAIDAIIPAVVYLVAEVLPHVAASYAKALAALPELSTELEYGADEETADQVPAAVVVEVPAPVVVEQQSPQLIAENSLVEKEEVVPAVIEPRSEVRSPQPVAGPTILKFGEPMKSLLLEMAARVHGEGREVAVTDVLAVQAFPLPLAATLVAELNANLVAV
jgi:hypothetical protein